MLLVHSSKFLQFSSLFLEISLHLGSLKTNLGFKWKVLLYRAIEKYILIFLVFFSNMHMLLQMGNHRIIINQIVRQFRREQKIWDYGNARKHVVEKVRSEQKNQDYEIARGQVLEQARKEQRKRKELFLLASNLLYDVFFRDSVVLFFCSFLTSSRACLLAVS